MAPHNIERRSPAYMAPEIFSGNRLPTAATIEDLKAIDIWVLGMVFFMLLNPNMKHPFENEIKINGSTLQLLKGSSQRKKCQVMTESAKFSSYPMVSDVFKRCTRFSPSERPTAIEIGNVLSGTNAMPVLFRDIPLEVCQTTAVESFDQSFLAFGVYYVTDQVSIPNDATNACSFLCLKVADFSLVSSFVLL